MASKKTLVIGASTNPERYSNKAIKTLLAHGHETCALGNKAGEVDGVTIETNMHSIPGLDTITLYLNPRNQQPYYDYILSLKPKRIIFNPGAENPELEDLAKAAGIETKEACTLVMLHTGQY